MCQITGLIQELITDIYNILTKRMAIDKDTIEQTWNVLTKLTSSERGTFLAIMIVALLSIVWIVIFYVKSMDGLIDKYNATINEQQKEFLTALKEFSK